jgi:hypothetical protein
VQGAKDDLALTRHMLDFSLECFLVVCRTVKKTSTKRTKKKGGGGKTFTKRIKKK